MEAASSDLASASPVKGPSLFASSDAKRAAERAMLLYTPVWGLVTAAIMMSGAAESWGDLPLLVFGTTMMLGAIAAPFLARPASERAKPLHEQTATKMVVCVVLLSFGLNYTQTPFFWESLHMHYGFRSTTTIDSNPIFLYMLTVAYFSTYSVLCTMAFRFLSSRLGGSSGRILAFSIAPFAMAFFETALNANPFTTRLFCYDDVALVLTYGTFAYGVAFVLILPVWVAIDERDGESRMPLLHVVAFTLAALYVDLVVLDFLQAYVSPHLTTVAEGARGLRDVGPGSCLVPR